MRSNEMFCRMYPSRPHATLLQTSITTSATCPLQAASQPRPSIRCKQAKYCSLHCLKGRNNYTAHKLRLDDKVFLLIKDKLSMWWSYPVR